MDSSPSPEGRGSVSGAPHLPERFADTFTSRYIDTGELRLHAVTGDAVLADTLLTTGEGERLAVWRKRLLTATVMTAAATWSGESDG